MQMESWESRGVLFSTLRFCKEYQTYINTMTKKILLLGSGELGKEFVIAAKRKGQYVIACDSYAGAPAMQVLMNLKCSVCLTVMRWMLW